MAQILDQRSLKVFVSDAGFLGSSFLRAIGVTAKSGQTSSGIGLNNCRLTTSLASRGLKLLCSLHISNGPNGRNYDYCGGEPQEIL